MVGRGGGRAAPLAVFPLVMLLLPAVSEKWQAERGEGERERERGAEAGALGAPCMWIDASMFHV